MKVAAYTIAKNERQFVERFVESAKQADYIVVLDTGSTDGTPDLLRAHGAIVGEQAINPWRFDQARNEALALVPRDTDCCIKIDLDETLKPGWRESLESAWRPTTTQAWYRYIWSWKAPGVPDKEINTNTIHARHGFCWKHRCHEVPYYLGNTPAETVWTDLEIWHFPDPTKSRAQYVDLLEADFRDDPSPRAHYYLAREYLFLGRTEEAKTLLERYLQVSYFHSERAWACDHLSQIYRQLADREREHAAAVESEKYNTKRLWDS